MKKILFLIGTLGDGGAERVLVDMVNHMSQNKFDITVMTIINEGTRIKELLPHIHYKSIVSQKESWLRNVHIKLITKILPARLIYKAYIKEKYDIEVAFLEGLATKIISASNNKNSRKIAWVHTDLMQFFSSVNVFLNYETNKEAYEKFDNIVGVSKEVVTAFIKRFSWKKDNVSVIYNVNDDKAIRYKAKETIDLPQKNGRIRIVSCGRLCEQKGYDRLLRIHKKLQDEGLKYDLWIVGDGDQREYLENYIRENNLEETVTLFGFHQNPYPIIVNADLFVCSSRTEGYSTVVTEAYILGKPVITTNVAGTLEPEECPRYSILCENDEKSLYEAIKSVLEDPKQIQVFKEKMKGHMKYFNTDYQIDKIEKFLLN